ncbi:MAG TPA: hypothetical protein VF601_19285 [Beijerinckiaceae bacterium]|jgi:hypothetical protein
MHAAGTGAQPSLAQPSFAKASVGFLASTTLLSIAMVFLGSL